MHTKIEAVFIQASKLSDLAEFYRTGLDLPDPKPVDNDQVGFQLGEVYFAVERVPQVKQAPGRTTVWFRVEDVRKSYDRLLTLGAEIDSPPQEVGTETIATLFDPEGNSFGLISG
jgi:predicted enzyme related to lactoylglutathione lyase